MLNRNGRASLISQNTVKLMSTMFSSPVSISASSATCRLPAAARSRRRAVADLDPVDMRHARRQHALDRGGQMIVETRLRGAVDIRRSAARCPARRAEPGRSRSRSHSTRMSGTRRARSRAALPKPPGRRRRNRSWPRRRISSRFGRLSGRAAAGPGPPRPLPHGLPPPPPQARLPQGPPPSLVPNHRESLSRDCGRASSTSMARRAAAERGSPTVTR